MRVGVLALQGDFREHIAVLESLGAEIVEVRLPEHLDGIQALVFPGGESTTIGLLAERYGLVEPLRDAIADGLPVLGTCAGMIFLAAGTTESRPQVLLGVLDVIVQRNAFGRQDMSFEVDLTVTGVDGPVRAVFIRAPWIEKYGDAVEVLATVDDHPVMVRQANILATSFHPEVAGETRVHEMLIGLAQDRK
ncbi:MAG TPA: pyridoxal 5'-phosphate synthase glutaminase subunit PdxT [Acidimicrobiia bacterium]|nr:pyridoxal 5'-phosphate synthase glutaminase subunit PdxT [Acidimicrobiia bacterium]